MDAEQQPWEFIVEGPAVSSQTKNRKAHSAWKARVRRAAEGLVDLPRLKGAVKITIVYYYEYQAFDTDNLEKPIRDALNDLVYDDDDQITDSMVRKTSITGAFRVRHMSPVLAKGFIQGKPFVYVRVEPAPGHEELL